MAVSASKTMTIPDPTKIPGEYFEVTFGPFSDDANAAGTAAILLTGAADIFPLPFATRERLLLTNVYMTSTTVSSVSDGTAVVGLVRKSNAQAVPTGSQFGTLNDNRICSGGNVGTGASATVKADGTTAVPIVVASTSGWTEIEVESHANIIEPGDHLYVHSAAVPTALEGLFINCRFKKIGSNRN